jgi:Tol biopolymer transport system component
MRPDGTDKHLLIAGPLDFPHWSPDGRLVVGLASGPNGEEDRAATIVDVQTGTVRQLVMPDPTLFTACPVWSADAARLFCEGLGESDRTGIWSIRSSEGGDLSQLTSNTDDDFPAEASPDGRHLLFTRVSGESVGTFIVNVDGTGLRQLVPDELIVNFENGGSWSPDSRVILFEARATPDSRFSIWSIRADGTGLHEVIGPPLCGGLVSDQKSAGCHGPEWSPDGTRFVFSRRKNPLAPSLDDIYVAHANGSGLQRLTTSPDDDAFPDWGVAPWTDQNRRPLSRGG